jgi:hypothetical protein
MIRSIVEVEKRFSTDHLSASFLTILPNVQQVARGCFRWLRCQDRRQECISETVALCWLWHRRLGLEGRDSSAFVIAMAHLAVKAVKTGRRLCGQESANDVMSPVCQCRRGFVVGEFDERGPVPSSALREALRDNTETPVCDQVQFRIDFPSWRATLDDRRRRIVDALMAGQSTSEVANQLCVTPGRVSQLRREFHDGYAAFCGDQPEQDRNHQLE